jgi:hypothetical protein
MFLMSFYFSDDTIASRVNVTFLFFSSLVETSICLFIFVEFLPTFTVTSISPSPPAGISLFERRAAVQPQVDFMLSITSKADPVFLKINLCFTSDSGFTIPKSYLSSVNSIFGFAVQDVMPIINIKKT